MFLTCLKKLDESGRLNYIVIDEAQCINSWGRHFREAYGNLGQLKDLFCVPFAALTGTVSKVTLEIIRHQLHFPNPTAIKIFCRRSNLMYKIIQKPASKSKEFAVNYVPNECGIICCCLLSQKGLSANYYHAALDVDDKLTNSQSWSDGTVKIMCCTSAFGMGIDKKYVRFVPHLVMPPSPEHLLQESGREGKRWGFGDMHSNIQRPLFSPATFI